MVLERLNYNKNNSAPEFENFLTVMCSGSPWDLDLESGILFLPNIVADSAQTAQCGRPHESTSKSFFKLNVITYF